MHATFLSFNLYSLMVLVIISLTRCTLLHPSLNACSLGFFWMLDEVALVSVIELSFIYPLRKKGYSSLRGCWVGLASIRSVVWNIFSMFMFSFNPKGDLCCIADKVSTYIIICMHFSFVNCAFTIYFSLHPKRHVSRGTGNISLRKQILVILRKWTDRKLKHCVLVFNIEKRLC